MRLASLFALTVLFTLGCTMGETDEDDDDDTEDNGGGGGASDPPVVYYLTRDADGNYAEGFEDYEDLCGDATFLGALSGTAACLDDGVHGVLAPMSNVDGETWPEGGVDDEADLCPAGWDYAGGNAYTATCTRTDTASSVFLYYGPDGEYYEDADDRGDICPAGWEYVGGSWYGAPLCVIDDWRPVMSFYENVEGEIIDDLDDPADTCPASWEYLGTWYGWAQCAAAKGTVISLYQRPDGETIDDVPADEMCGDGWDYVGSYYGYAVCWSSTARIVVSLTIAADGTTYESIDDAEDVCPEGWEFLGAVGGAAVCAE